MEIGKQKHNTARVRNDACFIQKVGFVQYIYMTYLLELAQRSAGVYFYNALWCPVLHAVLDFYLKIFSVTPWQSIESHRILMILLDDFSWGQILI